MDFFGEGVALCGVGNIVLAMVTNPDRSQLFQMRICVCVLCSLMWRSSIYEKSFPGESQVDLMVGECSFGARFDAPMKCQMNVRVLKVSPQIVALFA